MAYMVYQQYTTAVLEAYRGSPEAAAHLDAARAHREWIESLGIDAAVKSVLLEQARTLEEAFARSVAAHA